MIPARRKKPKLGLRKVPQIRRPSHLTWLRGHECAIAGRNGHACEGRIEAAHVRAGTDGGLGVKPSDCWTLPLCTSAHALQHQIGEAEFERRYGIDMKAIASALWARSPHRRKVEAA